MTWPTWPALPAWLLVVAAAALPATAAADSPWQLDLAARQEWQQWRETDAEGRRLVAEDGRLSGLAATLRWAPAQAGFAALSLAGWQGVRDYDGLSNRGQPAQTRSDLRQALIRVEAGLAPSPARWPGDSGTPEPATWHWQPTVAVEAWQWHRHLRDAAGAAGYPERYRQGMVLLGLSAQNAAGWRLLLELGGGPGGRNQLRLPGRDETSLPLGTARSARLALGGDLAPAWRWDVDLQALSLAAGQERPVTLQGVPLQSARQPRTALRRLQLQLSWRL